MHEHAPTCGESRRQPVNYATAPTTLPVDGLVELVATLRKYASTIDIPDPVLADVDHDTRIDNIVSCLLSALLGDVESAGPFILAPRCAPTVDIADDDLIYGIYGPADGVGEHTAAFRTAVFAKVQEAKDRDDHIVNKANDLFTALIGLIAEGYILRAVHEHNGDHGLEEYLGPDISTHLVKAWTDSYLDVPPNLVTTLSILRHRTAIRAWAMAKNWDPTSDAVLVPIHRPDFDKHADMALALVEIDRFGGEVDVTYTIMPAEVTS